MGNIIKSELNRIVKNRKNKWMFFISIVIFILAGFYIRIFNVGFYDPNTTMTLNSLNTPPFIIREFHMILQFVVCPMVFIECFNHEITSGGYRMVMTRGYKKRDYIIGKLLSCAIVAVIYMVIIFTIGTLFGYVFMNKVEATAIFDIIGSYSLIGAAIYNLKFYALEYLIVLAFLGISSVVGIVSKNSVVAYFLSIGVCIGSVYVSDALEFFLGSSKTIFDVLSGRNSIFIPTCMLIMITTSLMSIFIFNKKDYLN